MEESVSVNSRSGSGLADVVGDVDDGERVTEPLRDDAGTARPSALRAARL